MFAQMVVTGDPSVNGCLPWVSIETDIQFQNKEILRDVRRESSFLPTPSKICYYKPTSKSFKLNFSYGTMKH